MNHPPSPPGGGDRLVVAAIALLLLLYLGAAAMGWPQAGTAKITSQHHEAADDHHAAPAASHHAEPPPLWATAPFVLLLAAIAILPLLRLTHHWWESNLHRFYVAAGLGLITLAYYGFVHQHPLALHFLGHSIVERGQGVFSGAFAGTTLQNAILGEYVPFIILLFALYVISGGIRISGDLPAHPSTNAAFIAVGGLLASFIGTTGAAMVLIRPLLETNAERKQVRHTVVFFIFVVCNCGGCLLPIGDPPLFLGYLEGVDFLWTLSLWPAWAFVNVSLVAIYYLVDKLWAYPREAAADIALDERAVRRLTFEGLGVNVPLLTGVVLAVALLDPSKEVPGTGWHAWLWLREAVQLALVGVSLWCGSQEVRRKNRFSYGAIVEVAVLFLGIFICMQPALQILEVRGASLGVDTPGRFFWVTGSISAVLDNAPTYLVFFKTAQALPAEGAAQAGVAVDLLAAISLGAVFMGAMTYIGNGPNFMVKALAEEAGVRMPSFFGYIAYSAAVLLPLFWLTQMLFLS